MDHVKSFIYATISKIKITNRNKNIENAENDAYQQKQHLYIMYNSFLGMDVIDQSWCSEAQTNCSHKQDTCSSKGKISIYAALPAQRLPPLIEQHAQWNI